jgi:glycerate-2-kinase
MGLDPRAALEGTTLRGVCRAGRFVLTGPTRTNVNDFRALLIV